MGRPKKVISQVNSTIDPEVRDKIEFNNEPIVSITPLELNVDLGQQDLNDVVGKLQDKINELVKRINV